MYVTTIPNRKSKPTILIRESYREDGRVKNRTIANITSWPTEKIEALTELLKGNSKKHKPYPSLEDIDIKRSLPHGHVAAVFKSLCKCGLHNIIHHAESKEKNIITALIVNRIINPSSKLATANQLNIESATSSLSEILNLQYITEDDIYHAMDWLFDQKEEIEKRLAKRHLTEGSLVLYDITSVYMEGKKCPLAQYGHNRDKKKGKTQIVVGLLCDTNGYPVSTDVFEGNMGDPSTLKKQIEKIRNQFGIKKIVLVGDRGMITQARIREELSPDENLDWISALKGSAIKTLVENNEFEPSLFDEWGLAEIVSKEYPDERIIVCYNPLLAVKRKKVRQHLITKTEEKLDKIRTAVEREKRPLRGADKIGVRVGKIINANKVGKHFKVNITDSSFDYELKDESIEGESVLDGFYAVRTSLEKSEMQTSDVVKNYKRLTEVEKAFRIMKTFDLNVRPVYHYKASRVASHVFLCMLCYYVEHFMHEKLAPLLYHDENRKAVEDQRVSVVAPAVRSPEAKKKEMTKKTEEGLRVHGFKNLLQNLGTLTKNWLQVKLGRGMNEQIVKYALPTPFQNQVFKLLGVSFKV